MEQSAPMLERNHRAALRISAIGAMRRANAVYQSAVDLDRPRELAAPYMRLMMLGVVYARPYARIASRSVSAPAT